MGEAEAKKLSFWKVLLFSFDCCVIFWTLSFLSCRKKLQNKMLQICISKWRIELFKLFENKRILCLHFNYAKQRPIDGSGVFQANKNLFFFTFYFKKDIFYLFEKFCFFHLFEFEFFYHLFLCLRKANRLGKSSAICFAIKKIFW